MADLKLIALDADDLAIISAHLQDAVFRIGDMTYLRSEKCFAAVVNRFDWEGALRSASAHTYERRRSGVRIERVMAASFTGFNLTAKDDFLPLLALHFEPAEEPPTGTITLKFSGEAAIRLEVECIEVELSDMGAAWRTKVKPDHPDDGSGA